MENNNVLKEMENVLCGQMSFNERNEVCRDIRAIRWWILRKRGLFCALDNASSIRIVHKFNEALNVNLTTPTDFCYRWALWKNFKKYCMTKEGIEYFLSL